MKTLQLLLILCLVFSCKKKEETIYEENTAPDNFIFKCKVNSLEYTFTDGINSYAVYSSTSGSSSNSLTNSQTVFTGSGVRKNGSGNNGFVSFDNNSLSLSDYNAGKSAAISSMTSLGSHSYYQTGSQSAGVTVTYVDESNVTWSSKGGQQSGSTFNVTGNTGGIAANSRNVKGTFSCKVYNSGGSSKVLSEGYFYGVFLAP